MRSHLADRFQGYRVNIARRTLRDIAGDAGVNVATVWKIENDRPVSYKTFDVKVGNRIATDRMSKRQQKLMQRLAPILRKIPSNLEDAVCHALSIPSIVESLPALLKISRHKSSGS